MSPKILLLDIETLPLEVYSWGIWNVNTPINMIKNDWSVLSWCAKWAGSSELMYADQCAEKNKRNDKKILQKVWKLLSEADYVVTHNGDKFDLKKLNARFVKHGMQPVSSFKSIDTLKIAKRHFGFTSNKLEYLAKYLGCKSVKLTVRKFDGFFLWDQCLANNKEAYKELQVYNKTDVRVLEEVYTKLMPFDNKVSFASMGINTCTCGSKKFVKNGHHYSPKGKFQRVRCLGCGKEYKVGENLNTKEQRKNMRTAV